MRVSVLLTCHNRRTETLECLGRLAAQECTDAEVRVILVDDGCTDGTVEAVGANYPEVQVLHGSGQLYWAGGMRLAFAAAMKEDPDACLWINDDVLLDADALCRALAAFHTLQKTIGCDAIVVGSMRDPKTGATTYGGLRRCRRFNPLEFAHMAPGPQAVPCDTFNGNFVFIPRSAFAHLGNLASVFVHAGADYEYGLRARQAHIPVYLAPGWYGTCARNRTTGSYMDRSLPLWQRWCAFNGPKEHPWSGTVYLHRHYGGPLWPVFVVRQYVGIVKRLLQDTVCASRASDEERQEGAPG